MTCSVVRLAASASCCRGPAPQRRGREEHQQRPDDAELDEERVGGHEPPGGDPFLHRARRRGEDPGDDRHRPLVDVGAAFGDLAQPDRGKVRPGLGLAGDRLDQRADAVGGIERRRRCDRPSRAATAWNMSCRISP